ncbi:hypothetical protein MUK42_33597 [Musa troglodytarum]|uniref:Uncharacterized protein n=1 Tax=Musa troglodytarum TaxID=320322 RepID=A0A9E7JT94_9LILI|nr:hypothetical protein MUK42_33597 [Musa troglodytarum]
MYTTHSNVIYKRKDREILPLQVLVAIFAIFFFQGAHGRQDLHFHELRNVLGIVGAIVHDIIAVLIVFVISFASYFVF